MSFEVLVMLVLLALAFDFMNGFHDAANSIATIVSTRVLRPQYAVIWAAFFNFIAFLFFGLHVANTVGKGIIDPLVSDHVVVFGALVGAISWNVITWYFGIPSSSSHALIGGLAGAALALCGGLRFALLALLPVSGRRAGILGLMLAIVLLVVPFLAFQTPEVPMRRYVEGNVHVWRHYEYNSILENLLRGAFGRSPMYTVTPMPLSRL